MALPWLLEVSLFSKSEHHEKIYFFCGAGRETLVQAQAWHGFCHCLRCWCCSLQHSTGRRCLISSWLSSNLFITCLPRAPGPQGVIWRDSSFRNLPLKQLRNKTSGAFLSQMVSEFLGETVWKASKRSIWGKQCRHSYFMFWVHYHAACDMHPANLCWRSWCNAPSCLSKLLDKPCDTWQAGKTSLVVSRSPLTPCNVKFRRSLRQNVFLLGKILLSDGVGSSSLDLIQTSHLSLGLSWLTSCENFISENPKLTSLFAYIFLLFYPKSSFLLFKATSEFMILCIWSNSFVGKYLIFLTNLLLPFLVQI